MKERYPCVAGEQRLIGRLQAKRSSRPMKAAPRRIKPVAVPPEIAPAGNDLETAAEMLAALGPATKHYQVLWIGVESGCGLIGL
ncbi:MAG: hypothetical protein ACYSWU_12700 [Planctomycetota bacterium]|jgi:hypothetical protein